MKVKIVGAGSIGNHLAQASRRIGWDVTVVDCDAKVLARMKNDIYPTRYGKWDENITLVTSDNEPKGNFDIICIGTPPDVHMKLAKEALCEKPKILQIEKPLCTPMLEGLEEFLSEYEKQDETIAIVGYDHAVSKAFTEALSLLKQEAVGEIDTIDVEFREHWQGIFNAHPWLDGPKDTYLGFWKRGGGASGENSHALHLWLFLAGITGFGQVVKGSAFMNMKQVDGVDYDSLMALSLYTDKNKTGRVVQDVVTLPVRKCARVQGSNGFVEWFCGGHPKGDTIRYSVKGGDVVEKIFEKTRPDDFYQEVLHIKDLFNKRISPKDSPLSLDSAVRVMRLLAKAHKNRNNTFTA